MSSAARSALVTGAAGFIGSHLCAELVAQGHRVVGVDCFTDYYSVEIKRQNASELEQLDGFELVEANLNDCDLAPLLDAADVVFHLAGQPGVRASWGSEFRHYLDDNIQVTQRLLEACRSTPVGRVIFASSSSVYGDAERYPTSEDDKPSPISPYGVSKLAAEQLCMLYARSFGIPATALRYFTVYGPRQRPDMAFKRFIDASIAGKPIDVFGDGLQVRDFTYVSDIVAGTINAGDKGRAGAIYNISGGSRASVLDVVEILSGKLGQEIAINHHEGATGDVRETGGDTARARADLGYSPQVSLVEGLERQIAAAGG